LEAYAAKDYLIGRESGVSDMRNWIVFALIFLLLAHSCIASSLQLSGDAGRSLLGETNLNNSLNQTNATNQTDLWNWGKMPVGHFLNSTSGKLDSSQNPDESEVEVAPHSGA
jgi:hypothetical protein